MNYKEQIKLIQLVAGLTQDEIARKLGVTFVALNRWLNDKAIPHDRTVKRINNLYLEISEGGKIHDNTKESKEKILIRKKQKHKNILKKILSSPDIKDQFILSLTYNSNTIEGSTLSENETAAIIFHNKTFSNNP